MIRDFLKLYIQSWLRTDIHLMQGRPKHNKQINLWIEFCFTHHFSFCTWIISRINRAWQYILISIAVDYASFLLSRKHWNNVFVFRLYNAVVLWASKRMFNHGDGGSQGVSDPGSFFCFRGSHFCFCIWSVSVNVPHEIRLVCKIFLTRLISEGNSLHTRLI